MKLSKKEKKALKRKAKRNKKIISYSAWITTILVVYLMIKSLQFQNHIIIDEEINSLKITLIGFLVICPIFIYLYLKKMKEEYFGNTIVSMIASLGISFSIAILYNGYKHYTNFKSSKNNIVKSLKCEISSVHMSNMGSGMEVWYIFKNEKVKHILPDREFYHEIKKNRNKFYLNVSYKEGLNNSYLLESAKIVVLTPIKQE